MFCDRGLLPLCPSNQECLGCFKAGMLAHLPAAPAPAENDKKYPARRPSTERSA